MSARAAWHVWCDYCGEEMGDIDQGCQTAEEARRRARADGGHSSFGKDVCENCWASGKRGASDRTGS